MLYGLGREGGILQRGGRQSIFKVLCRPDSKALPLTPPLIYRVRRNGPQWPVGSIIFLFAVKMRFRVREIRFHSRDGPPSVGPRQSTPSGPAEGLQLRVSCLPCAQPSRRLKCDVWLVAVSQSGDGNLIIYARTPLRLAMLRSRGTADSAIFH